MRKSSVIFYIARLRSRVVSLISFVTVRLLLVRLRIGSPIDRRVSSSGLAAFPLGARFVLALLMVRMPAPGPEAIPFGLVSPLVLGMHFLNTARSLRLPVAFWWHVPWLTFPFRRKEWMLERIRISAVRRVRWAGRRRVRPRLGGRRPVLSFRLLWSALISAPFLGVAIRIPPAAVDRPVGRVVLMESYFRRIRGRRGDGFPRFIVGRILEHKRERARTAIPDSLILWRRQGLVLPARGCRVPTGGGRTRRGKQVRWDVALRMPGLKNFPGMLSVVPRGSLWQRAPRDINWGASLRAKNVVAVLHRLRQRPLSVCLHSRLDIGRRHRIWILFLFLDWWL